jgi:putative ABC transport system permease protein
MFADADPIGKEILIKSVPFEIVGLLENMGIDPHGEDRDEDVFVPISTAMRRLTNTDIVGAAKVLVSNHERVTEDAERISEILRERYQIAADERDDFFIYTSKFASAAIADATSVLTTYLYVATGVVLLVAATVVSSIMQVVVRDRIPEIGLRIAVGATSRDIRFQFFSEVIGVTVLSGLIGIAIGLFAAKGISIYVDVPLVISNWNIALGLFSALIVGVGAGVLPAHTAAKLNPVESLQ